MPPKLALIIGTLLIFAAFRLDRKRSEGATRDILWPSLWYLVAASRPIGVWLALWGISMPGGSEGPTEGSIIDRAFLGGLTLIGIWILSRRRFDWGAAFRSNPWLMALLSFMLASILWSQYPYVSFKRYIKIVGSVVMALVVLTDDQPFESVLGVVRRCLYIHLPMSIICIKYFRNIGVNFDWFGASESWLGIASSKNTLGQVAMLGTLYFFWEIRRQWPERRWRNIHFLYFAMALYLLKGSEDAISLTALSVCVFALVVFLRLHSLQSNMDKFCRYAQIICTATVSIVLLVLLHSIVIFSPHSFFGQIITFFGRDITLTDRTLIWSDVYSIASKSPLLGVGFGGFWIGSLANIPWNADMTWTLGQAHSGYIDTYLQLGLIGVILLTIVIFTSFSRLLRSVSENFDFACLRITLFLTILFVNITETTFLRGDHHLWWIFQIAILAVPSLPKVSTSLRYEKAA